MNGSSLHNSLFVMRSHLQNLHSDVGRQMVRAVFNYRQRNVNSYSKMTVIAR